jgi:tRNA G18 (ribose-2'-O)-methylase SpoU
VITVILDNVRSLYNVGAVMRACDGAGVTRLMACGITPYPSLGRDDLRRGPVAARAGRELRKTALAAYDAVHVEHHPTVAGAIGEVRRQGATVVAVEALPQAELLWDAPALDAPRLALVLGHETAGVAASALADADAVVRIPMLGAGASLNVAVAAALVLYEIVRRRASRPLGEGQGEQCDTGR